MRPSIVILLLIIPYLSIAQKGSPASPRETEGSKLEDLRSSADGYWYSKTTSGKQIPLKVDPKANDLTVYQTISSVRLLTMSASAAPVAINITDKTKQGTFVLDTEDSSTPDNTGTVIVTRSGLRYKRVIDGPVSVLWFGAKGDGSNFDNAPAIQAAVDFATELQDPAKDGAFSSKWKGRDLTVYLPQGIYKINKTIHIVGTVKLQGCAGGAYAGTQLVQGVPGISMISLDAGTDKVSNATVVEDIIFKSGSAKQNPNVAQIIIGTSNGNSNYVRNCWFQTAENLAIWITKGGDIQISGCTFDVLPFHAIAIGKHGFAPTVDVSITNNTFFEVALDIIRLYSAKGVTISGNRISNSDNSKHNTTFINCNGADIITSLSVSGNEYTNVRNFIHLPIHLFGCSINGNTGYKTDGYFLKVSKPGVIYGASIVGNSIYSSSINKANRLIDLDASSSMQGSVITGNAFYSISTTQTNAFYMLNSNNINNEIAHNTFTNFTAPYAVYAPIQNGMLDFKSLISVDGLSTGSGELLYHDGTKWSRLKKGNDGQILKMVLGKPTWVNP